MRDSKRLVAVSAIVCFGVLFLASLSKREGGQLPSSRQWIGLSIAFLMMSVAADLGSPLGGGFAVLTMVAILIRKGGDAFGFATGKLKPGKASPAASSSRSQAGTVPVVLTPGRPGPQGRGPARMGGSHLPRSSHI